MAKMVYIGKHGDEELYIKGFGGWNLMGLRPETEESLRQSASEIEITDYFNVPKELEPFIDHEKFAEAMEDEWLERHDSQGEYTIDGETYYLGFGMGTDIHHFFREQKIKSYDGFLTRITESPLTRGQFNALKDAMRTYLLNVEKGKEKLQKWTEGKSQYPPFTDEYKKEQDKKVVLE